MKKLLLLAAFTSVAMAMTAQTLPYQNPSLSPKQRAADLLQRLTLDEKVLLMMDRSPAIPRLGIPQFEWWNEALHGVGRNGFATVFPITMNLAATFNDPLVFDIYTAVSDEARAKNTHARHNNAMQRYRGLSFWTPNINIFRDPRWGRGQETYGEDPFLTTQMGLAVVRGLQGYSFQGEKPQTNYAKLFACAKHYAVHSGPEWNRHQFNMTDLPERDLWETYLPAFKALVQQGDVKEIMCAYQRNDGEPCCANTRYLHQILRQEWGFQGLVTSDCGAIRDFWAPGYHGFSATKGEAAAKAVIAGTDLECGSEYKALPQALKEGKITEEQINTSLMRLLTGRFELGDFDPDNLVPWTNIPMSVVASAEHKQLALEAARQGIVLLQNNNGVLPLRAGQNILVMGPNANDSTMLWGNYTGTPTKTVTILEGIREKVPGARFLQGCGHTRAEVFESLFNLLASPDGIKGVKATYWNNEDFQGEPAATTVFTSPIKQDNGGNTAFAPGVNLEHFSARYEATITPSRDCDIMINVGAEDYLGVFLGSDTLYNKWNGHGAVYPKFQKTLKAGQSYPLRIDYVQQQGLAMFSLDVAQRVATSVDDILKQASSADVVVFVGGISPRLEGEEMKVNEEGFKGGDRTSIELPRVQRDIIAALHRAGKPVVYVNCSGSAMALEPESSNADAIVQAWYCGEQGGRALADILFGQCNPSGKLPVTFYRNTQQLPDYEDYRMQGRTYRYMHEAPLFPFGHGLSYTTFRMGKPQWKNGKVSIAVTNTGTREGAEVVQVYVKDQRDTEGPVKTLRAFQRVTLKPGQTENVVIDFPRDRFERWDPATNTMRVVPGTYYLMAGNSSDNSCLQTIKVKVK